MSYSLIVLLGLLGGAPEVWPGFLGAGASEVAAESLPLTWSPTEKIAWQAKLPGHGQSSPVVWGDRVFLTAIEGPLKDTCHVICVSLADGHELWRQSFETSDKVKISVYVSRAAPTPVVDAKGVYAFFESGDVAAYSHTGEQLWHHSLSNEFGKFQNKFGLSASPVQTESAVAILVDDEGPSYLVALNKADGEIAWKQDRTSRASWSSPGVVAIGGKPQIVCSSAGSVDGYDPASGSLLWSFTDVGGNTAATPIGFADGKFLIAASPGREGQQRAEDARKSNGAMSVAQVDGKWTPSVTWKQEQATPTWGSPMVHRGCAYWVNRSGVVYCFDAENGRSHYTQRTKQSCWATPVGAGDRVYFFGKEGLTTVLAAGPEFKVLAENQLWDPEKVEPDAVASAQEETEQRQRSAAMFSGPTQYGVAVVTGSFVIRTGDVLYCVRGAK